MALNLNGPNVTEALKKAKGSNRLDVEANVQEDKSGEAEISAGRSWANGWDVAVYAKAWWTGQHVVRTAGGVKASKTF